MDKTYAETQGRETIDWRAVVAKGMRGELSDEEHNKYCRLQGWVTCAVGNACAIIPRRDDGVPLDGDLQMHGCRFTNAFDRGEWAAADAVLDVIEARSAELIAIELAKLNHAR